MSLDQFLKPSKKGLPLHGDSQNLIPPPHSASKNPTKSAQKSVPPSPAQDLINTDSVHFLTLAELYEQVGELKGANSKEQIKELVAQTFLKILISKPQEFNPVYLFSVLRLGPDYENWELGIGQSIIVKSISIVTGKPEKQIRELQTTLGDLGLAIEKGKATQTSIKSFFQAKTPQQEITLTVPYVFSTLKQLKMQEGTGSAIEKERILSNILRQAKPVEAKYIVRFIEKNLKIGAAEKTMQSALARAFQIYHKNKISDDLEPVINQALSECPNHEILIDTLKKITSITEIPEFIRITPGIPCKPMLAKPMKSIQMIFQRLEGKKFTCEYKYDGLRGQIHFFNGEVSVFSRNLENMTQAYPDVIQYMKTNYSHLQSFIIDSEIVAFDPKTNRILPFQTLTSRAKKNVDQNQIEIKVCLFLFDLLYLNGTSYLSETLLKRRTILKEAFKEDPGQLQFATSKDSDTFEEIEEFLLNSIKTGCEGLMIKTLEVNSKYEPAKRSLNWLKLKKDYLDNGLSDTFDLVPIGALYGTGKRKGFYGSYLLACYNDDMECYETICKIGTGFSDENLEKFFHNLQEYIIPNPLPEYKVSVEMDVWFNPVMVWEVKGADIQVSPIYAACQTLLNQNNKGVGLRFPRLIKVREDKKPNEATNSRFIFDIYKQQAVVASNQNFENDDDYY